MQRYPGTLNLIQVISHPRAVSGKLELRIPVVVVCTSSAEGDIIIIIIIIIIIYIFLGGKIEILFQFFFTKEYYEIIFFIFLFKNKFGEFLPPKKILVRT
jgi:hypothetical protein